MNFFYFTLIISGNAAQEPAQACLVVTLAHTGIQVIKQWSNNLLLQCEDFVLYDC